MIFKENKYTKWYYRIIENVKNRNNGDERHHIIPKSLGGSNDEENLINLTYREHFVVHLLLTKMCIKQIDEIKMCWALHRLTFTRSYYSSHQYEMARKIHIKNLRENHPSQKQSWRDAVSERVFKDWENNEERKRILSQRMKERYKEDIRFKEISINNLPSPMIGKDNPVVKEIEYRGIVYYGWRELKEASGISKHLYKKYYSQGIDPIFRIGTNGPIPRNIS